LWWIAPVNYRGKRSTFAAGLATYPKGWKTESIFFLPPDFQARLAAKFSKREQLKLRTYSAY
jgi:hypothetical protein